MVLIDEAAAAAAENEDDMDMAIDTEEKDRHIVTLTNAMNSLKSQVNSLTDMVKTKESVVKVLEAKYKKMKRDKFELKVRSHRQQRKIVQHLKKVDLSMEKMREKIVTMKKIHIGYDASRLSTKHAWADEHNNVKGNPAEMSEQTSVCNAGNICISTCDDVIYEAPLEPSDLKTSYLEKENCATDSRLVDALDMATDSGLQCEDVTVAERGVTASVDIVDDIGVTCCLCFPKVKKHVL